MKTVLDFVLLAFVCDALTLQHVEHEETNATKAWRTDLPVASLVNNWSSATAVGLTEASPKAINWTSPAALRFTPASQTTWPSALGIVLARLQHLDSYVRLTVHTRPGLSIASILAATVFITRLLSLSCGEVDPDKKEKAKLPMSFYESKALHTMSSGPKNPTFLYWVGKNKKLESVWPILWFTGLFACLFARAWVGAQQEKILSAFLGPRIFLLMPLPCALVNIFIYRLCPWPEKDALHRNDPEYLKRIGCLVPCHKSAHEITNTVKSLLQYLQPEHIVVIDNGNNPTPFDNTKEILQALEPRVHYMWIPIGLKTNGLWHGLAKLPNTVDFVMHIDDDTELPSDFVFDETVWENSKTTGVSYGITMKPTGLVEKLVDFEFRQISQFRLFQSQYSTVWFAHGIIGLWRRSAFDEIMQEHPFLPFGEDAWIGTINLLKQNRMHQELRSCVSTYAPSNLFPFTGSREQGYGAANIWKQRAERWFVNAPRRTWLRIYCLFFYKDTTIMGSLVFKILSMMHLAAIVTHVMLPIVAAKYLLSDNRQTVEYLYRGIQFHWYLLASVLMYIFVHWLDICSMSYFLRHRPELQPDAQTILAWPFYSMFLQVCCVYGHWRSLLYYIPFFPMRTGMYTEGLMDTASLKKYNGIEAIPEEGGLKASLVIRGAA